MDITLVETLETLKKEGCIEDFNLQTSFVSCKNGAFCLHTEDFHTDKFFRFEGANDPEDSSILYAISSEKHQIKVVLVNAYGVYAEPLTNEMVDKLR